MGNALAKMGNFESAVRMLPGRRFLFRRGGRPRRGFGDDFRRFFARGLEALLPTLITLWLVVWAWNFLWFYVGRHMIWLLQQAWGILSDHGMLPARSAAYIGQYWQSDLTRTRIVGVVLAVLMVYIVGVFVGNFIGRTAWRLVERTLGRVPLIRAIYPPIKQVTDFILSDRGSQFEGSRVVAVRPHEDGIWSIALITGPGVAALSEATREEMVTVFVPSTPTAFSGYMMVVPRRNVVDLPLSVEEAMRLLVSGGVIAPPLASRQPQAVASGQ
jgi:uncharacterized membrane protein